MSIKHITERFSVSGPVQAADLPALKQQGVSTLLNVRMEGEEASQVSSEQAAGWAQDAGLAYQHIPVKSGVYPAHDVQAFTLAIQAAEGKVHGFCRTGTRAIHLWALANPEGLSEAELIALGKQHNVDLTGLVGNKA